MNKKLNYERKKIEVRQKVWFTYKHFEVSFFRMSNSSSTFQNTFNKVRNSFSAIQLFVTVLLPEDGFRFVMSYDFVTISWQLNPSSMRWASHYAWQMNNTAVWINKLNLILDVISFANVQKIQYVPINFIYTTTNNRFSSFT